ncbi:MAG: DUF190 domain-containing protein [Chlamydiae bacterium]|nr:DUF190 domain-containing protein [Chlamydiota bacterium]
MKGVCLRFYSFDHIKHKNGTLLYEWLLEFAKKHRAFSALATRAVAGFGKDHILHEEHFFELASDVPIEITVILNETDEKTFLELLKNELPDLLYSKTTVTFGVLNRIDSISP